MQYGFILPNSGLELYVAGGSTAFSPFSLHSVEYLLIDVLSFASIPGLLIIDDVEYAQEINSNRE